MQKPKKRRGISWFAPIVLLAVIYFVSVVISQQSYLNQIDRDQVATEQRLQAAKEEHARLTEEREALNDPHYIEKVAREELGMTKRGELPYAVVEVKDKQ